MGQPKALIRLGGKTILQHAVSNLRASRVAEIVVVLGHRAEEILPTLRGLGCRVVVNHHYARGMSSSIRRGLSSVDPRAQAVLIALGDQPDISAEIVDQLLSAYFGGQHHIVVPTCDGRRGHPVIFDRRYWSELRSLGGDVGGQDLLLRHAGDLLEVEVGAGGIIRDIDRPEDIHS
jgi:molybdenum cofactor cytidylyltransferase